MSLYEVVFLARQDLGVAQVDQLAEDYKQIIVDAGGSVSKTENWGLRQLAYRINKVRKAHYILMNVTADHAAILEMERRMRLSEDVVRFLTVSVEEHEEGPSAVMRAKAAGEDRAMGNNQRSSGSDGDGGGRYSSGRAPQSRPSSASQE